MRELMISLAASITSVAAFTTLQCKANAKRVNRNRQVLFPLFAFIYGIVSIVQIYYTYGVVSRIFQFLGNIANFLTLIPGVRGILGAASALADKLHLSAVFASDVFASNMQILLLYEAGRVIPLAIFLKILTKFQICTRITKKFYDYDEESQQWYLKDKWLNLREMFYYLVWVATGLCGILLGLGIYVGRQSPFHVFIFPTIIQIVLVEVYNFLNGFTKEEYQGRFGGEESYSKRIGTYYKIREIYEKLFPKEILSSGTGCDYASRESVTDLLEQLDKSDDELERKIARFFNLNGAGEIYDTDNIHATLKLIRGENVVFFQPFYRNIGKYLILPVLQTLLGNKKCLFVVGRNSVRADVINWVQDMIDEYGKIESLWRVRNLDYRDPDFEIGIMGFSQLYDRELLDVNRGFLEEVGFVFMLEASLILNTGQVGISILADIMRHNGDEPVYCIADRMSDGLVDTMSHLIQDEITEVVAPPVSRNVHTTMSWNADGDYFRQKLFERQTRHLGNGIELAAVAIKNQVPSVTWYSESKSPLKDIKWLAGQYYPTLCKYMNLPIQQESIYERIGFEPNLWSASDQKEQFLIADDEFENFFAAMRTFMSLGTEQIFVNILSDNYLLRDYMRYNSQMFKSNPDVISTIVPTYAKTERNCLIKLMLEMTSREFSDKEILQEFRIAGVEDDDAGYLLGKLLKRYFDYDLSIFDVRAEIDHLSRYDVREENFYRISQDTFDECFTGKLNNAFYICEEEDESEPIDAKMFGHVVQTIMPGQYITYGGKYYVVEHISSDKGVVLRRASLQYDGARYYRQIRKYTLGQWTDVDVISRKTIIDIEVTKLQTDFDVTTSAYLEMYDNHDLRSSRKIDFVNDPHVDDYSRSYRKKNILKIKLPDADEGVCFTFCMLLSEIFRTIYPSAWPYLAVVSSTPDNIDGILKDLVYKVDGAIEKGYIYILEDSEMDLGLIESIEKNLMKYMEIVTDFLNWHTEMLREEKKRKDNPVPESTESSTEEEDEAKEEKGKRKGRISGKIKSWFRKIKNRIKNLFRRKNRSSVHNGFRWPWNKKKQIEDTDNPIPPVSVNGPENVIPQSVEVSKELEKLYDFDDVPMEEDGGPASHEPDNGGEDESVKKPVDRSLFEPDENERPELVAIDGTDIFDDDGVTDDDEYWKEKGITPGKNEEYYKNCFLTFGFDYIDPRLKLEGVRKFLMLRGFGRSSYRKARTRDALKETVLDFKTTQYCDFCGKPLNGVSYDKLNDGRVRCNDCTSSAINLLEDFQKIFLQTVTLMQNYFGIDLKVPVSVRTTDAHTIARAFGSVYKPTAGFDARVLGFARRKGKKYSIYIENGSPRLAAISVMAHELTHIWQYIHWNEKDVKKLFPSRDSKDRLYEGMAVWVSIQYLYMIGEMSYAQEQELISKNRDDVYGEGFKEYLKQYDLNRNEELDLPTPFELFPPIKPE